jgi:hypothetical protein
MKTDRVLTDDELHALVARTLDTVAGALGEPAPMRTDPRRRHRWVLPCAAASVVALGIGSLVLLATRDPQPLPPLEGSGPTLGEFGFTDREAIAVESAQDRMMRDCMATRGQPYRLQTGIARQHRIGGLDEFWSEIGRTDATRAATLGYQPSPRTRAPEPNAASFDDPAFLTALEGGVWTEPGTGPQVVIVDPRTNEPTDTHQQSGGCFGQVMAFLYGDQARFTSVDSFFLNELDAIQRGYADDPRLSVLIAKWADCMGEKGYQWQHPLDPMLRFIDENSIDVRNRTPSAEEVRTAVDDVACKQSTGLLDTARELRIAYGRKAVAEAPDIAAEHGHFIEAALERSARFEAGELRGPWRNNRSPSAPANSDDCTWLPDHTPLDMSPGERAELLDYLGAIAAAIAEPGSGPEEVTTQVPPPWLINGGACQHHVTADEVESAISALGP